MPSLYFGSRGAGRHKPRLYDKTGREIESRIFDKFKVGGLSPDKPDSGYVAHVWHIHDLSHTAVSWRDTTGNEHTLFMNGLHQPRFIIPTLREEFAEGLVPSSIVFRLTDYDNARVL